jgi:hypothetical protein
MIEGAAGESTGDPDLDAALSQFVAAAIAIGEFDLTALVRLDGPSDGLLAAGRMVELGRRAAGAFDRNYVTALEAGDEPARHACPSTAVFLRDQLRLSIGEGRRRVALTHACGPRIGLSGDPLPPRLPALAAAISQGQVSADQAAVVLRTMDALPGCLTAEQVEATEAVLVDAALVCEPGRLGTFATRVLDRADPDGALRDYDYALAHRGLTLTAHRGRAGGRISGDLSVELFEKLQTTLSPLAAPRPADENTGEATAVDLRSPQARTHDALLDLVDIALSSDALPASGGTPTTVVFHIRAANAAIASRTVLAETEHGNRIPVPDALAIADNAAIYLLLEDARGVPLELGRTTRIATAGQTVALAARDRGCTFPGCTRPPSWCQRHHVREWQFGGGTDIDNLVLLCGYHHREFERRGWRVTMVDGLPWWLPPRWIDPQQRPIRNRAHDYPDTG